jgi:hypothetical protein
MYKILIKQPVHILQSLPFAAKFKISFILLTLYAYVTERLYHLLPDWQNNFSLNNSQATNTISSIYILLLILIAPIIFKQLIPKEKRLSVFYTQSLSKKNILFLSVYFFIKYLFILIILYLPFINALLFIAPLSAIYNFSIAAAASILIFLIYFCDYAINKSGSRFLRFNMVIYSALFISAHYVNLLYFQLKIPINLLLIILSFTALFYRLRIHGSWDLISIFPPSARRFNTKIKNTESRKRIPKFLPLNLQTLFSKEVLNLWRNPAYRINKIVSVILYFISLLFISLKFPLQQEQLIPLISIIAIWLHFSSHFNRKYTTEDPDWYFHTLPLKYRHVWLAKFIAEFIPIILITIIQFIFLHFNNVPIQNSAAYCALIVLFSLFALTIKLNFQVLFYDNVRLAGYAYHFSLIFMVVMCINYRFIGPLISLILLISYFYKSYRFLKG